MNLKPQDILVLLKLVNYAPNWTFRKLASELFMSVSEVHQALNRAGVADLYDEQRRRPKLRNLEEFIVHGLRYAFPCEPGAITRGLPTSFAAAPLREHFFKQSTDLPPVWSDPEGSTRGYQIAPLYSSVPKAVKSDPELYQLLALIDAIREGRARERQMAQDLLHDRFAIKSR